MDADGFADAIEQKLAAARGEEVEVDTTEGDPAPEVVETPAPEPETETPETDTPAQTPEEGAAAAADEALAALPDDATEEQREEAAREAAQDFYAGRYKTREDTEEGLRQKDSTIGRLGQEVGQLRKQVDEAQRLAQEAAQATEEDLDVPAWNAWADSMVKEGAGEAGALKALEEGGYPGYEIYLNRWLASRTEEGEIDTSALAQATNFNNQLMLELAEIRARQAQEQAPSPVAAPAGDVATQARAIVEARHPDIAEYEQQMTDVLAGVDPDTRQWLTEQAQSGPQGTARALEYVLLQAKAGRVDSQTRAQQVADRQVDAADRAAKVGATVASSEASVTRTPRPEAESRALKLKNERRVEWGLEPLPED